MMIKKVCVFCASSTQLDDIYVKATSQLAKTIAKNGITSIYGGGSTGLMGVYADVALSKEANVIGVIPQFMVDVEWAHHHLTDLIIVNTMAERKERMIENVDAVIALPGGCGTLEELLEVITLKRLGLFTKPIIIININGFYDPLEEMLNNCITEKFLDEKHGQMWIFIKDPSQVINAIKSSPEWKKKFVDFVAI